MKADIYVSGDNCSYSGEEQHTSCFAASLSLIPGCVLKSLTSLSKPTDLHICEWLLQYRQFNMSR